MEGWFGKGVRVEDPHLKLLDLIPNGGGPLARRGGDGAERERLELAEQKLELRLAPPGTDDWPLEKEQQKQVPSAFSLRTSGCAHINASAGAKRGFSDALESQIQGFQVRQATSFLHLASAPGLTSQKVNVRDAELHQRTQSLEEKAGCAPSVATTSSGNPTAALNGAQSRTGAAPVVGWPPVRSFRKTIIGSSSSKPTSAPRNDGSSGKNEKQEIPSKGKFVKINMDGIPIGRKVDLTAYDNYEKLASAVDELFRGLLAAQTGTPASSSQSDREARQRRPITGLLDGSGDYALAYEDEDGDKLLVGNEPWNLFVSSVKRLRVVKSSELSPLSLGANGRKGTTPESHLQSW